MNFFRNLFICKFNYTSLLFLKKIIFYNFKNKNNKKKDLLEFHPSELSLKKSFNNNKYFFN